MTAAVDYEVWIPSRHRADTIGRTLAMIPSAKVYVDEREEGAYRPVVGRSELMLHPPASGLVAVRAMMLKACTATCLVMVDDDLRGVVSLVGIKVRKYTEPTAVLQIIENMVNVSADLGLPVFGWNRNPRPLQFFASDPFGLVGPVSGAWGMIGHGYKPDAGLSSYEDLDLTMQVLRKDRVVLVDRRFYFDFGGVWRGKGGNQGLRTSESEDRDRLILERKWGAYISVQKSSNVVRSKTSETFGMSVRVRRRGKTATTR